MGCTKSKLSFRKSAKTKFELIISCWYRHCKLHLDYQQHVIFEMTNKYIYQSIFDEIKIKDAEMNEHNDNYLFRIIVFGQPQVGKTSIIKQYVETFRNNYDDCHVKILNFKDDIDETKINKIELQIFDSPHNEQYVTTTVAGGKDGVIFVAEPRSIDPYHNIDPIDDQLCVWNGCIERHKHLNYNVQKILVINKYDMINHDDTNDNDALLIKKICKEWNISNVFKVSAKTGENIDIAFETLVKNMLIIQKRKQYPFYG
eukprot:15718_1